MALASGFKESGLAPIYWNSNDFIRWNKLIFIGIYFDCFC